MRPNSTTYQLTKHCPTEKWKLWSIQLDLERLKTQDVDACIPRSFWSLEIFDLLIHGKDCPITWNWKITYSALSNFRLVDLHRGDTKSQCVSKIETRYQRKGLYGSGVSESRCQCHGPGTSTILFTTLLYSETPRFNTPVPTLNAPKSPRSRPKKKL